MKKLLLVGVVGLSALLAGCGGGEDCNEASPLPPVEDVAQFPRGQAPEYIVRTADEIEVSRMQTKDDLTGQVVSMELVENSYYHRIVVQEFETSYEGGYQTKPTNNIHEFTSSSLRARIGDGAQNLTYSDLVKMKDDLLTVKKRGGSTSLGGFHPHFEISIPVMGPVESLNGDTVIINGLEYKVGKIDESVKEGKYVAGVYEGTNLNIYNTSFVGPAWGIALTVEVKEVLTDSSFYYEDALGYMVIVNLREEGYMERSDRLFTTDSLKVGQKVLVKASKIEGEINDASVYSVE